MNGRRSARYRRLNITLPQRTVRLLERVAKRGSRSRLIAAAIDRYVEELGRRHLRKQLKNGAVLRAERDLGAVEAWFPLEEEAWAGHKG